MTSEKWVYEFSEGSRGMRELLGGKGANVAEMTRVLGDDRVPPGFTVTTEACVAYTREGHEPDGLREQVAEALEKLEQTAGKRFGDDQDPLLVSVRSGARESMPGMLDTILNVGLNDTAVQGLAAATGNERFAWDSYRRLVQMFGNVAQGVASERSSRTRSPRSSVTRASRTTPSCPSTRCASWSRRSRVSTPFQTTLASSWSARSAQCSSPGRASGRSPTAGSTGSPTTGGRPSTSSEWCSGTWATTAPPASRSAATR